MDDNEGNSFRQVVVGGIWSLGSESKDLFFQESRLNRKKN